MFVSWIGEQNICADFFFEKQIFGQMKSRGQGNQQAVHGSERAGSVKQQNKQVGWKREARNGPCDSLRLTYKKGPKYSRWARVGQRLLPPFLKRTVPPLLPLWFFLPLPSATAHYRRRWPTPAAKPCVWSADSRASSGSETPSAPRALAVGKLSRSGLLFACALGILFTMLSFLLPLSHALSGGVFVSPPHSQGVGLSCGGSAVVLCYVVAWWVNV